MKLETLISTMNTDECEKLVKEMNINSDSIIINQCDYNNYEEITYNKNKIKIYSFCERGIGLSRNNALMRANSDIVIFADNDIVYVDNYEKIIMEEFRNNPKADMILFNLESNDKNRPRYVIKNKSRLHRFNSLKYGAVRIAVRLEKVRSANICFSLLFGGGAKYGSGEDTLFINECLKKHFKIYTSPTNIGMIKEETSSWFKGYNEKFFIDKGALYTSLFPKFTTIFFVQFILRHKNMLSKEIDKFKALKLMKQGKNEFLNNKISKVIR